MTNPGPFIFLGRILQPKTQIPAREAISRTNQTNLAVSRGRRARGAKYKAETGAYLYWRWPSAAR